MSKEGAIQKAVEIVSFCAFDDLVVYFWQAIEISTETGFLFLLHSFSRLVTTANRMSYVFIFYVNEVCVCV